jgi:hypothetical protein
MDSEDVFNVPCHQCGTTRYHSQVATTMCENRQKCNTTRENLSDAVMCEGQQANQQANVKRKSPAAQVKHTGSCKYLDFSRRSSGANQYQGRQVAEGEEMPIDPPALNDDTPSLCTAQDAQKFAKNVHNRDAERGRNAAPRWAPRLRDLRLSPGRTTITLSRVFQ